MAERKTKKAAAPKPVCTEAIYLQFGGKEISTDEIRRTVMENYNAVKKGEDAPEDIRIYLKPEEGKAYYVINSDYAGEVSLLLR